MFCFICKLTFRIYVFILYINYNKFILQHILYCCDHFFFFGLFSLTASSSCARLNCFAACLIAGLPSKRIPLGSFPSGEIFFIFKISSDSYFKVENILFIFPTDWIFPLMIYLFLTLASSLGILERSVPINSFILISFFPSSYSS